MMLRALVSLAVLFNAFCIVMQWSVLAAIKGLALLLLLAAPHLLGFVVFAAIGYVICSFFDALERRRL